MFGSQIFHFVFGVILNPFFGGTVVFTIEVLDNFENGGGVVSQEEDKVPCHSFL